jgi:nicotinamide riboside kinase
VSRLVAVIGAECSGKSALAGALGRALPAVVVPEQLRVFVDARGRVPTSREQALVMAEQIAAERRAAAVSDRWVVSDAGALMTAIYSLLYYDDDSLVEAAVAHHRDAYAQTVWCGIDLPWVPDGAQRDGPAYREKGHALIGAVIEARGLEAVPVAGPLDARLASVRSALAAVRR